MSTQPGLPLAASTPNAPSSAPNAPPVVPPTAAKRKYDEVLASMSIAAPVTEPTTSKRAKRSAYASKTPKEQLIVAARYLIRAVNPYLDVGLVLAFGAAHHWNPPSTAAASNTIILPQSEIDLQKKHWQAFDAMMASAPGCLELVREFYGDPDPTHWTALVTLFRESARSVRQQDTNNLKSCTAYLLPNPVSDAIVPPVSKSASKSDRGINHPLLRNHIVPPLLGISINEREDTDEEGVRKLTPAAEEALRALLHNETTIDASEFPSCFYAEGAYNPDDTEEGLFRSPFLARVCRHLWLAPGSALHRPPQIPPRCNARAHNKFVMEPEMTGYACAQGRTMISTSDWDAFDGLFSYTDMWDAIMALFKTDPQDPWAVDTLAWYQECSGRSKANRQPIPLSVRRRTPPPPSSPSARVVLLRLLRTLLVFIVSCSPLIICSLKYLELTSSNCFHRLSLPIILCSTVLVHPFSPRNCINLARPTLFRNALHSSPPGNCINLAKPAIFRIVHHPSPRNCINLARPAFRIAVHLTSHRPHRIVRIVLSLLTSRTPVLLPYGFLPDEHRSPIIANPPTMEDLLHGVRLEPAEIPDAPPPVYESYCDMTKIPFARFGFTTPVVPPSASHPPLSMMLCKKTLGDERWAGIQHPKYEHLPSLLGCLESPNTAEISDESRWSVGVSTEVLNGQSFYVLTPKGHLEPYPLYILVPSAVATLMVIRMGWGPDPREIIYHLLKHGVEFRLCLRAMSSSRVPLPPPPTGLGHRRADFKPTFADYEMYVTLRDRFLTSPRGRAALFAGGIVGQLARQIVDEKTASRGPSSDVFLNGICLCDGHSEGAYWDDVLTEQNIDLICGVYEVATGRINKTTQDPQTSQISWWPKPNAFSSSGLNTGW
ncbi:hypothetical protein DFH06DRAFT_1383929 [Mycena polygramma]|nr:hypothetical protein DFH06DRAFT_1383929 [Mycena polygramma]